MIGVYDSMKKLIDKCDLYFEGHIISKELLLQNYALFLAGNFEKKHNVAISLHTGSICFDILTVVFAAISNIVYNRDNAEDFITSLNVGDMVLYKKTRCRFDGLMTFSGETIRRAVLYSEAITRGVVLESRDYVQEDWWYKISPYNGKSTKFDARGIRTDNKKRNDFLSVVLEMDSDEIPAYIEKSSVIVMNREYSEMIINNLEIGYDGKRIRITEIIPVSYCSENEEYPYGGNPGKVEPTLKITNNMSNARSLVTGSWKGNKLWVHDVIGVSVIGFGVISRARTEVAEIMKRRKLKYVFVSYNIAFECGETLLDEVDDASVFACTTEYLRNCFAPTEVESPYSLELNKQVESVINHETIPLAIKTFDCDWCTYRKVQLALSNLRHSGNRWAEEYVPLAYSVMNLMITSVFPLELMETLIDEGILEVESPLQRIIRLTEFLSNFTGEDKNMAQIVLNFLEDGYTKLLSSSPKEIALFDLLENNRGKKTAVIVPKAYYAQILYHQKILDYFEDASQLCISTANNFDCSQQYDIIIAIGVFGGKKFDLFRCYSAATTYVMVSSVEENLFRYRRNLASATEHKINVYAKIPMSTIDVREVYTDGATEGEVAEVIKSAVDVTAYINQIFEAHSLEMLNTSGGTRAGMVDISYVATGADGERIFFTPKYRAFVFDSAKEDVFETSVDRLSPGDTVIFKSYSNETKDIVTTLLDRYLAEYNNADIEVQMAYWRSQHWKAVLKKYREQNKLSFKKLSKELCKFGCKKHEVTIQTWLADDSYIVGPQDDESYTAIAEMTQDPDMMEDPGAFCRACESIRRVRIGILKLIAKAIIGKYSGQLAADGDMAHVVSENIDDISVLVQIETITPVTEKKAPINMINRPLLAN